MNQSKKSTPQPRDKSELNKVDHVGSTKLHRAAEKAKHSKIKQLVTKKNINQKNFHGNTPLKLAVTYGGFNRTPKDAIETVKVLAECGADLNVKDSNQITPLSSAFRHSHWDMAKTLIALGADTKYKIKGYYKKYNDKGEVEEVEGWYNPIFESIDAQTREKRVAIVYEVKLENIVFKPIDEQIELLKKEGETVNKSRIDALVEVKQQLQKIVADERKKLMQSEADQSSSKNPNKELNISVNDLHSKIALQLIKSANSAKIQKLDLRKFLFGILTGLLFITIVGGIVFSVSQKVRNVFWNTRLGKLITDAQSQEQNTFSAMATVEPPTISASKAG